MLLKVLVRINSAGSKKNGMMSTYESLNRSKTVRDSPGLEQ